MKIEPLDLFEVAAISRYGLSGLAALHASYPGSRDSKSPSAAEFGASTVDAPKEDAVIGFLRACDAYSGYLSQGEYKALAEMARAYGMVRPTIAGIEGALDFCKRRLPLDTRGHRAIFSIEKYVRLAHRGNDTARCWAGTDLGIWVIHAKRTDLCIVLLAFLMGGNVEEKAATKESGECLSVSIPL